MMSFYKKISIENNAPVYITLKLFFLTFTLIFISSCSGPAQNIIPANFSYDLQNPSQVYELDYDLSEISGISFLSKNEMAIIEDENGIIFGYDLDQSKKTREIYFHKDGDYEDLVIIHDTAWVLKSDGKLFEVKLPEATNPATIINKFVTGLSKDNNCEGLCYDQLNNALLIACKGSPDYKKAYTNKKAIYSFNLRTGVISDTPFVLIDLEEVKKKLIKKKLEILKDETVAILNNKGDDFFEPSGIAIHPLTNEIYVISSVSKLLVVLDPTGKLISTFKLPHAVFRQPEGIVFDAEGNLFISNEGKKGRGNILKFLYLKK